MCSPIRALVKTNLAIVAIEKEPSDAITKRAVRRDLVYDQGCRLGDNLLDPLSK